MESQDGRSGSRWRWRRIALPATITAAVIVVFGLCNAGTELTHEGGEWYTGYAGSTHTGLGKVDLYHVDARDRRSRVDTDVLVRRFYPPDCILYEPGRDAGVIHAVCGNRQPVRVAFHPPWRMHGGYDATDDGLRSNTGVRVVNGRAIARIAHVPLEEIRRVARAAPRRAGGPLPSGEQTGLALEPSISDVEVDPASRDRNGWTPLHEAVRDSQPDVVVALLDAGADVDAQNDFGATALLVAIGTIWPDTVVIRLLLRAGADTELADRMGTTPLLLAALGKKPTLFTTLLEHGANPCARDREGRTIVDLASDHDRLQPLAAAAWRRCTP